MNTCLPSTSQPAWTRPTPRGGPRFLWPCALDGWLPLVLLVAGVLSFRSSVPPWVFMWFLALGLYAGCKWLTWREAVLAQGEPRGMAALAYLFLWPGMNASTWVKTPRGPCSTAFASLLRLLCGFGLIWGVVPRIPIEHPYLVGWAGMVGIILVLHFGCFEFLALGWQAAGYNAPSLMSSPLRARNLAEFWGQRWNRAFHDLASVYLFKPLTKRFGARTGVCGTFLVSGLIHELVITFPAGGGYGGPTVYFALQAIGLLWEKRLSQRGGALGRLYTVLFAAVPAPLLFPPIFVDRIILPMLQSLGVN